MGEPAIPQTAQNRRDLPSNFSYTVGAPSFSPYRSWIRQFAVFAHSPSSQPAAVDILRTRQTFYQPHQTYEPEQYSGSPY